MLDPYALEGKAKKGQKLLNKPVISVILIYVAIVLTLYAMRKNQYVNVIGYYTIFFPLWVLLMVLIILSYIFFWKFIKFVVYGSVLLGLILLLSGYKLISLVAFGPAAIILLLFIMFFLSFLFSILGVGLIVAIISGIIFGYVTHSPEFAAFASIIGFIFGAFMTFIIYTKIILPFSFGFSLSLIAANISSAVASLVFFLRGAFFLPSIDTIRRYLVSRSYGYYPSGLEALQQISNLFNFFIEYFKFLAEKQLIIFIGSVIVGIATIIVVNAESIDTETKEESI